MKDSNLLLGISLDIDTFKAHLKRISKDGYKLHELDKDLLLQKTRDLYDNILKLETSVEIISTQIKKPEKEVVLPKKEVVKIVEETIVEKEITKPKTEEVELDIQHAEPLSFEKEEVIIAENNDNLIEESKSEIEDLPKAVEEKTEAVTTFQQESGPDLFSTNQATISDRFEGKDEKSLADKLQQSKLNDLRSAIGINEKFLFINELFSGDMGRYDKTLDELNSMQSKTGLDTFFMELKIEKQWNEEEDAFVKFKELVDRKFA